MGAPTEETVDEGGRHKLKPALCHMSPLPLARIPGALSFHLREALPKCRHAPEYEITNGAVGEIKTRGGEGSQKLLSDVRE